MYPTSPAVPALGRTMLNKVPEVTVVFWLIKVMCTTVGGTAAGRVAGTFGFGLTNMTYVTGALLSVLLLAQLRSRRYTPALYWAVVVVISVFGTLAADNMSGRYGIAPELGTPILAILLAGVLAVWWAVERTLSIRAITTTRREGFYWLAILVAFALGTTAGALVAEQLDLGYAASIGLFGVVVAVLALAGLLRRTGAVTAFWLAYVMTRPLGAAIADELARHSHRYGGLGLGTTGTSSVFAGASLGLVGYLTLTGRDRIASPFAA